MKKPSTETNTTPEARAFNEATAALDAAIAATAAARAAHTQAEANMKTVRPRNLKERQQAVLQTLAELNECDDIEAAARAALTDAKLAFEHSQMLAYAAQADEEKARAALEAALATAMKHADELRAEFAALEAILKRQREAAYSAKRIARLSGQGWDAGVTALPANLAEALQIVAAHESGTQRVVWLPALPDSVAVADAVRRSLGIELPSRNTHAFASSLSPDEQIKLALGGELKQAVKDHDAKVEAELAEGQAKHNALVEDYRVAHEEHARTHSAESRARLIAARDAFKPKREPKTPKPKTGAASDMIAERAGT